MCIAICKPEGVIIPTSHLEACFQNNPDGAGFAYAENDKLTIHKGLMTFDAFTKAFKEHKEKAAIIHFRITTHGDTDEYNTHPFEVGKNLAMIHNGVINAVDRKEDLTKSDTYHFNTQILNPLYKRDSRFIFKNHFKELIKHYIGYSKLVFINNKGHFQIINEQAGTWDEGVWYSNTSYKPRSYIQSKKSQAITKTSTNTRDVTPQEIFTQGSRVSINLHNKKGKGTIMHFTGGLMVGVKVDGEQQPSLIPMAALELLHDNTRYGNEFEVGDWVTRVDRPEPDLYEVTGTAKHTVWIQQLDDLYRPHGSVYVVNHNRLIHYSDWGNI